jgi:hypothetical protein
MSIPGLRGTGAFTTDFRPTNYRELYTFLEPNGDAPLNALLAMLQSEATDDPKYSNFRDEMPSRVLDISVVGGGGNVEITVTPAADAGALVRKLHASSLTDCRHQHIWVDGENDDKR